MNNNNYIKLFAGNVMPYKELRARFSNSVQDCILPKVMFDYWDDVVLAALDEYLDKNDYYLPGMTCDYDAWYNNGQSVANSSVDHDVDANILLPTRVTEDMMKAQRITPDEYITFGHEVNITAWVVCYLKVFYTFVGLFNKWLLVNKNRITSKYDINAFITSVSTDEECTTVNINVKNAGGLKEDLIRIEFILDSYYRPDAIREFDEDNKAPYSGLVKGSEWADNGISGISRSFNSLGIRCIVHLKDTDDTLDWSNYNNRINSIKDLIGLFNGFIHFYE